MIVNYLITALRAFKQQKQHFLLNVIGLSVGLAAAILVALFAKNELSFDQHQPNAERVYRVGQDYSKLGLGVIPIFNYNQGVRATEFSQVEDVFALKLIEFTREAEVDVKHNNQLTGPIPKDIGSLTLTYLALVMIFCTSFFFDFGY